MSLKEIFCQDKAISILQKAYAADRMSHAYIFAGPDGVGKFTAAKAWARLLLCENPLEDNDNGKFADSCSLCRSCRLIDADSHPDFIHIYKELREFTTDGKDKPPPVDLPIDVIREFLIEKISVRPTHSKRKVFVVSESEKLNKSSQNSLLKVLEEPPIYCTIILLCTRLEKLLPTTKSRCQIIRFCPVDEEITIEKLRQTGLDADKAKYFARLSQGSLGQACKLAQLELADANVFKTKKELINSLANYEYADALDLAVQFLAKSKKIAAVWTKIDNNTSKTDINRRAHKTIIRIIISAIHDGMKIDPAEPEKNTNFDQEQQIKKLTSRFNPEQLAEKISKAFQAMRQIDASVNEKLIFEQLLLTLADYDKIKVL